MNVLVLSLAGPVVALVIATVYWCGRVLERRRDEIHIEVLKLRAKRLSAVLYKRDEPGDRAASSHIDDVLKHGNREALIAVLHEEGEG